MGFVGYKRRHCYDTYRTNIATIVLPSTLVHYSGCILIFWLLSFTSKKEKERFRTDISEITLKRTDKSYSLLYSLSPDYTSGGLVSQTPLLLGFRQIPAYKSIVPLQGFEPCFVPRLSRCLRIWALWLIPGDPHISGIFVSLPWNEIKHGYAFLNRLKTNS